jgi:hypothetical protein
MGVETPEFDETTNTISIPEVDGIVFTIAGKPVSGDVVIRQNTVVRVAPQQGFVLAKGVERNHRFSASKLEGDVPKVPEVTPTPDPPVPAEPVVVSTAGSDPENAAQQASEAEAGNRYSGQRTR